MSKVTKKEKIKIDEGYGYCRKCRKSKPLTQFYEATNLNIDTSGYLSVCRDCANQLYQNYFSIHNNLEIALDLTCRDLDIVYDEDAVNQTKSHIESLLSKGKKANAVFGYYKSKLSTTTKTNSGIDSFRYKDGNYKHVNHEGMIIQDINCSLDNDIEISDESKQYWGRGRDDWEYEYLDNELFRLQTDFECSDYGMEMIMKDICFINLEIERIRQGLEKGDVSKLIASRSNLMNDGNLKPVQSTGADKNEKLSFGVFIKKWENERPVTRAIDDEMKKYIDTFMVGHLAKMEGLNNESVRKYEEAIKDYTIDLSSIHTEEYED